MPRIDFDEAFASATMAHDNAKDCSTTGSTSILFDATMGDGKSLKAWCKDNEDKCRVEEPRFEGSETGIIELFFKGGKHAGKGCIFKKEAAHDAFGKSIKWQGFDVGISFSTVI